MDSLNLWDVANRELSAIYQLATDGTHIKVLVPWSVWEQRCGRVREYAQPAEKTLQIFQGIDYLPEGRPIFCVPTDIGDDLGYGGLVSSSKSEDEQWVILNCPLPVSAAEPRFENFYPSKEMRIYCANIDLAVGGMEFSSDASEFQLMSIQGLGLTGLGLSVLISRVLARWIGGLDAEKCKRLEEEVSLVMRIADHYIIKGVAEPSELSEFSVGAKFAGGESQVYLYCYLNNSGSVGNQNSAYGTNQSGYELVGHNLDGPWQILVILAGLAKLCEIARAELYLK